MPHDPVADLPAFDVATIPFSVRGAWIDLSPVVGLHRRADLVHLVSHQQGIHPMLSLQPTSVDQAVPARTSAEPGRLAWAHDQGIVEATFASVDTVRLRGHGLGLTLADAAPRLTSFTGTYLFEDPRSRAVVFGSYETGRRYRVTVLRGSHQVVGVEALGVSERSITVGDDGLAWECVIEECESERAPFAEQASFDDDVARNQREFARYLDSLASWRDETTPAAGLAAYVMWSATVRPGGFVNRESVLMSKHWMDRLWSWDHCFNALALAAGEPTAAWDQFLAPFDHQNAEGAIPDSIAHNEVLFNYVKPPIHGWALLGLRARLPHALTEDQLREAYERLAAWTQFWLDGRRVPGHVLSYYQHGNDSGWDNSTTFDRDRVIESPDLAGFLVLQLDVLAGLALELGDDVRERWVTERDAMLAALLEELWDGEQFVARGALTGTPSTTTSLLNLMPLLIADRLPADVCERLADELRAHLTPHGLATEPPSSVHYKSDGYWRGPIWAPSTTLLEDGLRRGGYTELADTVSLRFRRLCERSGFAENFDALTGAGLRDRAYTWTASSYLLLAEASVRKSKASGEDPSAAAVNHLSSHRGAS